MKALLQVAPADYATTPGGDRSTLKLVDIPKPEKAPAGHIVMKVHAAALNPVDIKRTVIPLSDGETPVVGYDAAGTVHLLGEGVTRVAIGDRVYGDVVADTLALKKENGSIAEFIVVRADLVSIIPHHVSFVDAAAIPLVAQTAVQVLRAADLSKGERVFLTAGAGGVGMHLMQIAKQMFGASEVATTASAAKEEFVKTKGGADVVVDYKTKDAGVELAGWADVAIDTTEEMQMVAKIAKDRSRVKSIVNPSEDLGIPKVLVQPNLADMNAVAAMQAAGTLKPIVDSVFSLAEVDKALERQGSGRAMGKVVIQIV